MMWRDCASCVWQFDATLDAVARPCLDLTQFASLMRYPGCPDLPEPELAWPWLHTAEALVAAVAERLGGASQEPAAGMR